MEAITLLLFVGAVWVLFVLGLFAWNLLNENHEHADRLALLPLEDNWNDRAARTHETSAEQAENNVCCAALAGNSFGLIARSLKSQATAA